MTMEDSPASRMRLFYGWRVVLGTLIVMLVCSSCMYAFSVFVKPLSIEFEWSRLQVSGAVAVWAMIFGFASPFAGWLIERYGARVTMVSGTLVVGSGALLLSSVGTLPLLYVAMALSGIGSACCGVVPTQTVISYWFETNRGRALALGLLGFGIGGLFGPPIGNLLLESYDWRTACRIGCVFVWLTAIPTIILLIRTRPSDLGMEPLGGIEGTTRPTETPRRQQLAVKEILRLTVFWQLLLVQALLPFGAAAISLHFVAFADDVGFSSQRGANCLGLALGISILGRLLAGQVCDRWTPKILLAVAGGLLACSIVFLVTAVHSSPAQMAACFYLFAVCYGLGLGACVIALPILVGLCFAELRSGKVYGMVFAGSGLGIICGPIVAGRVYDVTGEYALAFQIILIGFALLTLVAFTIRPSRAKQRIQELKLAIGVSDH